MRRFALMIAVAMLGATSLTGCSSFDPSDLTDWFNVKKPLPGDRRAVFPEGVPGVSQGVPSNLVKGAQPEVAAAPAPQAEPEAAPAPAKAKAKAPARPRQQAARPPQPAAPAQPAAQAQPRAQQPQPQAQQAPDQNNWPAPPASGSFSR